MSQPPTDIFSETRLRPPSDWRPRYNLAPSQNALAVRADEVGTRKIASLKWGLIPSWSHDASIGSRLAMARAESLEVKATFRDAFRRGRCGIVADGFFEWVRQGATSTPIYFRFTRPLMIAGLWERWKHYGHDLQTFCVITTAANGVVGQVHERMPVLLDEDALGTWLRPQARSEELHSLLRPTPDSWLRPFAVGREVNNPKNDYPALLGEIHEEALAFGRVAQK